MRRIRRGIPPLSTPLAAVVIVVAALSIPALPASSADKTFSITSITPDMPGHRLMVTFSARCDASTLRGALKIFPPVRIGWSGQEEPNRVAIEGHFKPGEKYELAFPDDFECDGRRYVRGVTTVRMPDLPTEMKFAESGTVIERDSRQILNVTVTNADNLSVLAVRIPPILLPLAADGTGWRAAAPEEIRGFLEKAYAALPDAARRDGGLKPFMGAFSEDRRDFSPRKPRNEPHSYSIPLSFRKDREKGAVAVVAVESRLEGQGTAPARGIFRLTDIGLACKRSRGSLLVWATSLRTGLPLQGVTLLAVTGDGRAVLLGKTGKEGDLLAGGLGKKPVVALDARAPAKAVSARDVDWVFAATDDDVSYLRIGSEGVLSPDWLPPGEPVRIGELLFKGEIFTERGIYRPGDPVTFKGTVRRYEDGVVGPPGKLPVEIAIENARKEEIYRKTLTLSEFGTVSDRVDIHRHFPVGTYTIRMALKDASVAGDRRERVRGAGSRDSDEDDDETPAPPAGRGSAEGFAATFEVQEFRPPRHFASIHFRKRVERDDSYVNLARETALLDCEITGSYYAGGGVKNGKVRWKISYTNTSFRRSGHGDYTFGSAAERRSEMLESGEAVLDGKGKALVTVPLSPEVLAGASAVEMSAVVVDFDGRAAAAADSYQEEPAYVVGIGVHDESVNADDAQVLRIVVVGPDGKRVPAGIVQAEVNRKDRVYVRKRNEQGHVYWRGEDVYRKQLAAPLSLRDGQARFEFDFQYGGEYLLKFTYKGKDGAVGSSSTLYRVAGGYYGWDAERIDRRFEKLSAVADRKSYAPGDTARIYLSPHRKLSSLLVTVEREGVMESRVVIPSPGQKHIDVDLDRRHAPNAYVTLLGTVARGEFPVYTGAFDDEAPTFLFGAVNVEVRTKTDDLRLAVNEEEVSLKGAPGDEKTLTIVAKDGRGAPADAEMAVAVVDESILALTGFRTPDLSGLARFRVPLSVTTAELRTRLLLQTPYGFVRVDRLTGGDGGDGAAGATSKVRKDFNPVAFVDPSVRTGPGGTAQVRFRLPDTMTTYRVYVVACDKGSAFASVQKSLLVVKDFYLEPGLPAFFTRGDRFTLLVSAVNKTKGGGTGTFAAGKDDLVGLSAVPSSFGLAPLDRSLVAIQGEAKAPGTARLSFSGTFGGFSDAVEVKVPVNSGNLLWNDIVSGALKGTGTIRYAFPKGTESIPWSELGPQDVRAVLTLSGSPLARMGPGLRYLLHYPYGCVEQTSSGLAPLAALRGLIRDGMIPGITVEETDKFIRPGVERLLSMQVEGGGFGYWPGYREVHPWGTVYAMTALTFVRKAGLAVPDNRFARGLSYLAEAAVGGEGSHDPTYKAFAAYILAMNGKLQEKVFRNAQDAYNSMGREAALLTLVAGKIGGFLPEANARAAAREILDKPWVRERHDVFFARYREPAISLMAATAIVPDDPLAGKQAARLLDGINPQGYWTSTSDTGWSLVALGEYFRGISFPGGPVAVSIRQSGGPEVAETLDLHRTHTFALDPALFLKAPEVAVAAGGNASIVYQLQLTFPRVDYAVKGYANGFTVGKTIKPLEGGDRIRVGDVVRVDVTVETGFRDLHYLVVDDPLPAGLVAINTALKTEEQPAQRKGVDADPWNYWDPEQGVYRFNPSHFEIRDDRVLAFRDRIWWGGKFRYSYYARAVLAGEFLVPSSKVQLMYEPDIVGYTSVTKLVVEER
ncbi:MAG: alpha-2-macroglobulin family protein [Deltaproteobacteria bacterium]